MSLEAITATLERDRLRESVLKLGETSQRHVKAACRVTAENIQRDARARLNRQLGPNKTGATEAGIIVRDDYTQVGFVVMAIDRSERIMSNLPLWIEKGTKQGKPGSHSQAARPFFYPAIQLEAPNHIRRVEEAMQQAADEEGLGQ